MAEKNNSAVEALSGLLRGLTTDTVGAPVDLINMALKATGAPVVDAPVGGSKWMRSLLDQPAEDSTAATAGNLASALVSPGKAAVDIGTMLPALAGIFIGPKSKVWNKEAAEYLEAMEPYLKGLSEAEGKAAKDAIFKDLNVFRSPDGKLRQEIPDNNAYHRQTPELLEEGRRTLDEVLSHPELYKAYPQLRDMPVYALPAAASDGSASYSRGGMFSSPMITYNPNSDSVTTDLLHEIQHAIQSKEGFARGGNPDSFIGSPEFAKLLQDNPAIRKASQEGRITPDTIANMLYRRLAGEAEARAVEARAFASPDILREAPPFESYDVPVNNLLVKFYDKP